MTNPRTGAWLRAIAIALITSLVGLGGALIVRRIAGASDRATASALVAVARSAKAEGDEVTAVRAIERARMLEPRSAAVNDTRSSLHVVDPEPPMREAFRFVTSDEWAAIAIAGAWAAAVALTLAIAGRGRRAWPGVLAGGLLLAAAGNSGVALAASSRTSVVGSGGAPLLAAPYAGAEVIGNADAATLVVRGERDGAFVHVRTASGWAWIDADALAPVNVGGAA